MSGRQSTVIAIMSVILAACGAGAQPMASMRAGPDPSLGPSALALVSPTPTTLVASPTPVATAAATPAAAPKPTAKATRARVPPKPTGVKFRARARCVSDSCHRYTFTQAVAWESPLTKGVEIRVYGVTECLAEPAHAKPGADGPCLVEHTPLPASVRILLATAPASAGKVTWSWTEEDPGCDPYSIGTAPDGQPYRAVVAAAYGASGHSIFAIAEPGEWWVPRPGDMVC